MGTSGRCATAPHWRHARRRASRSGWVGDLLVALVGRFPARPPLGESDTFLIGYTPDGTHVSTKQFGTADIDFAYALDGLDVYVAGRVGDAIYDEADAFRAAGLRLTAPTQRPSASRNRCE